MTDASVPSRDTSPAPGWYPDPEVPGQPRWWDGHRWHPSQILHTGLGRGFATLARILVAFIALQGAATLVLGGLHVWGLHGLPPTRGLTTNDFPIAYDLISGFGSLLSWLAFVVSVVLWCIWQHGLARVANDEVRRSPGMHVGSWFIPVVNVWFPFQNMRDLWASYVGRAASTTLLGWWWASWLVAAVADRLDFLNSADAAGSARAANGASLVYTALDLPSEILAAIVVVRLTRAALAKESSASR